MINVKHLNHMGDMNLSRDESDLEEELFDFRRRDGVLGVIGVLSVLSVLGVLGVRRVYHYSVAFPAVVSFFGLEVRHGWIWMIYRRPPIFATHQFQSVCR